jgi:hypothetical protein
MEINKKLLYSSSSVTPIICERDNWKNCPDHKHLSEVPLKDDSLGQETINELNSNDSMIDDPNDDIISVNEYQSALGQNNDKIKTQIDLMEGDSLLRRSYRYDAKQESSDKNVKVNRFITHANESKLNTAINLGSGIVGGPLVASAIQFGAWIPAVAISALVLGLAYFLHSQLDKAIDRQLAAKYKSRRD